MTMSSYIIEAYDTITYCLMIAIPSKVLEILSMNVARTLLPIYCTTYIRCHLADRNSWSSEAKLHFMES